MWSYLLYTYTIICLRTSHAICNTANGCSPSASCAIEFIDNAIYGCDGVWYSDGLQNAEYLCGRGYHICQSHQEAYNLGLTKDICTDPNLIPKNWFYVTHQSSSGSLKCTDTGKDDVFGCGSSSDDGFIYLGDVNNAIDCGPFGAVISTLSAGGGMGWVYGWEPWGASDQQELVQIEHRNTKTHVGDGHWEYTNRTVGGVLCCKDDDIQTTLYTTTEMVISECDGCSDAATCDVEYVSNTIFGCGGTWEEPGIENAEYLCGEGYEICHDGDVAATMGLTKDDCVNKGRMDHFYASSARSYGDPAHTQCDNFNLENVSKPLGYNDVYGCGESNTGWIRNQWVNCGSFGSKIEFDVFDEAAYGWKIRDYGNNNELKGVRHLAKRNTDDVVGGVLCCKKNNETQESKWSPWEIKKSDKHKCKVSTGCTRTTGFVSCDVEFIPNRVYGCSGLFETMGVQNGEWLCRNGYSLCNMNDVISYGLTKEMCASYPKENYFYASSSSTFNGYLCDNDTSAGRGIFGCGLDVETNWMWTISEWSEYNIPVSCGPYTAALTEYNIENGKEFGWNVSNGGWRNEKYYMKHLSWDHGGVMCCRNLGESTYEAEYTSKLTSFYTARTCEFVSLFITVLIIIISFIQSGVKKRGGKRRKSYSYKGKRGLFGIEVVEIVKILTYCVYFVSLVHSIWSIITIWVMVNHDENSTNMSCAIRSQGVIILNGLYKLVFYLFLIYKIEGSLNDSIYAYHPIVYTSLKIYTIIFVIISYFILAFLFIKYQQFPGVIGGYDCYYKFNGWLLWFIGIFDTILSIICCSLFTYKLLIVIRQNMQQQTSKGNRLLTVIFNNLILSLIALISTWIFYYIGFQQIFPKLDWFFSLDFAINNLCIWLMFKQNQTLFRKICCGCCIYFGNKTINDLTQYIGSRTSKETSKTKAAEIKMPNGGTKNGNNLSKTTTSPKHLSPEENYTHEHEISITPITNTNTNIQLHDLKKDVSMISISNENNENIENDNDTNNKIKYSDCRQISNSS